MTKTLTDFPAYRDPKAYEPSIVLFWSIWEPVATLYTDGVAVDGDQ